MFLVQLWVIPDSPVTIETDNQEAFGMFHEPFG